MYGLSSWKPSRCRNTVFSLAVICITALHQAAATAAPRQAAPFSTDAERCIVPASLHHGVNFHVLRAILVTESSLNSQTVSRNSNGTVDIGLAGVNSIHLKDLAKLGVTPESLLDACVSTYVAAWFLKKQIVKHGNTWEAVARYHSKTTDHNQRYQVMIKNELIRSGAMEGTIQPVPKLTANDTSKQASAGPIGILIADTP